MVGDLAFKREAHLQRLDSEGALLVFGTMLGTGDDAERALRVALGGIVVTDYIDGDRKFDVRLRLPQTAPQLGPRAAEIAAVVKLL